MKATTRNMAEAITQALGPVFHANPDYKTITEAIALTVARVAQSTVDRGFEHRELDDIYAMASHALTQFLNEEEARLEAKQSTLAKGIDAFAEMARSDEDDVSHEEFYRNSGLNPEHYGPANGLAAINGGVSPEACADAEEFAGRYQDEEGKLTKEGMESLTKAVIALHTPDPEEANWSNSTINEEIARFECENKDLRPNLCNPDGPRAYAP